MTKTKIYINSVVKISIYIPFYIKWLYKLLNLNLIFYGKISFWHSDYCDFLYQFCALGIMIIIMVQISKIMLLMITIIVVLIIYWLENMCNI